MVMVRLGRSSAAQCEFTIAYQPWRPNQNPSGLACGIPYQSLPRASISCARGANPLGGFGLVVPGFTTTYHTPDLARNHPSGSFTNHYHRTGGLRIKPDAPVRVGQYRWRWLPGGQGLHSIERWHTVAHSGEPYTPSEVGHTVAQWPGRCREGKRKKI